MWVKVFRRRPLALIPASTALYLSRVNSREYSPALLETWQIFGKKTWLEMLRLFNIHWLFQEKSTSRKYKLPIFVDWTLNGENDFLTFQIFYFPNPLLNLFFVEKWASISHQIINQNAVESTGSFLHFNKKFT